jgi:hypothetical protein
MADHPQATPMNTSIARTASVITALMWMFIGCS